MSATRRGVSSRPVALGVLADRLEQFAHEALHARVVDHV